jgi:hypothetical protein
VLSVLGHGTVDDRPRYCQRHTTVLSMVGHSTVNDGHLVLSIMGYGTVSNGPR